MGLFVNTESQLFLFLEKINQTLVTILVFWLLHQSLVPLSQAFQKLEELLSIENFSTIDITGLNFNPILRKWKKSKDLSVNYIISSSKN